jgi:hypothetical protein
MAVKEVKGKAYGLTQISPPDVNFELHVEEKTTGSVPEFDYRAGSLCPKCKKAVLDYDGLLNLVCPNCGTVQGGCFT